jgi:hypothetical protein
VRGDKKQVLPAACVIEKDVKVNIIFFRTWCSIEFEGLRSRETLIWASWKIIFLESTVQKLCGDASFVHDYAVRGDKKHVFPAV